LLLILVLLLAEVLLLPFPFEIRGDAAGAAAGIRFLPESDDDLLDLVVGVDGDFLLIV
jgi:hypothetical protein